MVEGLTGMFISIKTRKYRDGTALYFSRASRPFTAHSDSRLSLFIRAKRSWFYGSAVIHASSSLSETHPHVYVIVLNQ
jgi:CMP-2-keto-3-deoxyoctulosonic acid synthetase